MKIAGLLTNGGDTSSLNALLRYSRDALIVEGFTKIYGFQGGFRGLISKDFRDITSEAIDPQLGGTFLLSMRDSPTPSPADTARMELLSEEDKTQEKTLWDAKLQGALNTLKQLHIDVLVILGGNGTIEATVDLAKYISSEHNLICIPRTIDNDVNTFTLHRFHGKEINTAVCPGFPSAAEKVIRSVRRLRNTASSTNRLFTIETMGRDAGWLALASAFGWAEVMTIPEVNLVENQHSNNAMKCRLRQEGRRVPENEVSLELFCEIVSDWYDRGTSRNVIIGVSEGTMVNCERITMSQYGPRKLGGAGDAVSDALTQYIRGKGQHLVRKVYPNVDNLDRNCYIADVPEVRCQHLDYEPRMGGPSTYDLELAKVLGYKKLRLMLRHGEFSRMPVLSTVLTEKELKADGVDATKTVDIRDVGQMLLPVQSYYDTDRLTSTKAFDDFLFRIVGEGLIE